VVTAEVKVVTYPFHSLYLSKSMKMSQTSEGGARISTGNGLITMSGNNHLEILAPNQRCEKPLAASVGAWSTPMDHSSNAVGLFWTRTRSSGRPVTDLAPMVAPTSQSEVD
jgi:hypothetical protein